MKNFKSQICTTKEQSEKLLALGLKKESADMVHVAYDAFISQRPYQWCPMTEVDIDNFCPAWSLHRLVEMIPLDIWHTEYDNSPRLKHTFWFCKHAPSYNSIENIDFRAHSNLYDNIIDCIE